MAVTAAGRIHQRPASNHLQAHASRTTHKETRPALRPTPHANNGAPLPRCALVPLPKNAARWSYYKAAIDKQSIIPPELDLAEAERDLHNLDLLRPQLANLRQLVARADDTEMALGSDILTAALEGYALAKVFGKGAGVDASA